MKKIKLFDAMSDDYISSMDSEGFSEVKYNAGVKIGSTKKYIPIPGGLYDPAIFGKEFAVGPNSYGVSRCSCGRYSELGRCPHCHELLLDHKSYLTKGGYYSFCVPFIGLLQEEKFLESISKIVDLGFISKIAKDYGLNMIEAIWCCEFIPTRINNPEESNYVIKYKNIYYKVETKEAEEDTSDIKKCGLLGIISILELYESNDPSIKFKNALKYINRNLFITPVSTRPVGRGYDGLPVYPPLTQAYSMIIQLDTIARQIISGIGGPEGKLIDKLAIASNINKAITLLRLNNLSLLKTSKDSLIRYHGTGRVPCSFRANIISAVVPMDTVLLPKSICYEAVKGELIKRIQVEAETLGMDPIDLYYDPTPKVMEIFEDLIENSIVLLGRQPTLYKYGQLAFKCRLWKESDFNHPIDINKISSIGMNIVVCSPFNADFDGDQMYGILFTQSPDKEEVWRKAGVENNWKYQKNNESVFVPKKEILAGLHVGTKLVYSNEPIPEYHKFNSSITVFRLYNNKQLMFNTPVVVKGEITTYGIEKLSHILHKDLKSVLNVESNDLIDINSKTMKLISEYIANQPDRVTMITDLMNCGDEWIKKYGSSLIRLSELYKVDTKFPEIEKIINSHRSEKEKLIKLDELLSDIIRSKNIKSKLPSLADKMPGLVNEMNDSGIKPTSVVAMVEPIIINTDSGYKITNESLIAGYSEESFVNHASTTREILKEKSVLVPLGGYINKCVTDALTSFVYKSNEFSTDNRGILVRRIDAIGRYDLNGNLLGTPSKDKANELVRIKSCIYSKGDSTYHIACDELNKDLYSQPNNGAIGVECANASTEEIIQSQLALKHGGKLFSPSLECIKADRNLTVIEVANDRIILGEGVNRYIYPLPAKFELSLETVENRIKSGDVIYYIDEMQYVDYNIKRISSVIGFRSSSKKFNPNATNYETSECISPTEGEIKYYFDKKYLTIGSIKFKLNPNVVYYYPDGYKLRKYQKFCSGTLSPKDIMRITSDIEERFGLFYTQFKGDGIKDGLMPSLQILSIELLFKALFILGKGDLKSAIANDPFQLMKNQKATSIINSLLEKEINLTLAADMILGLNMRDLV